MICPQCRVEYREGFTQCSDCRVPLVEDASGVAPDVFADGPILLQTDDPALLDQVVSLLDESDVTVRLETAEGPPAEGEELDFSGGPVLVRVAQPDEKAAREILREALERYSLDEGYLAGFDQDDEEEAARFDPETPGALAAAAAEPSEIGVAKLLKAGVDPNQTDAEGRSALMAGAGSGDELVVRDLLEAGADVRQTDPDGVTALHHAAHKGNADIVRLLLEKGAEVDARTKADGLTPLMLAAEMGRFACAALLLKNGADATLGDAQGETAVSLAARMGFEPVSDLLDFKGRIAAGLKPALDEEGRDALAVAAATGNADLVSALLYVGADIEAADARGRTALVWAAIEGRTDAATMLLDRGAAVDAPDAEGDAALQWAAENGHADVVRLLLERGAEAGRQDADGWDVMRFAEENGHRDVVRLLEAYIAEG